MKYSYISHLECPKCHLTYEHNTIQHLCTCGSPLLVEYDLSTLSKEMNPDTLLARSNTLWRYHELLPISEKENVISMGEGMTPLIKMKSLGKSFGMNHLYMKDEGIIPTGTFKARGAAVGISKAKELGVMEIAMPTNGNAGAAWALYAAKANIYSTIVMPIDAPLITRNECAIAGANLYLVDGLISDAGKLITQGVKKHQLYDVSTLKEPYRIEGKKTMGLELLEQLGWEVPDVILYPTGGGVGLIGIYKALQELRQLGWISSQKLPRLVAVQAEGCAPIVKAWEKGKEESTFWEDSKTIAFGINVPKALGDFLVLKAIYDTEGCAVAVKDEDVLEEQGRIAKEEGAFICPEGAATIVAAQNLLEGGWIKEDDRVIVLNTGSGIKYPNTVKIDVPILQVNEAITPSMKN